MREQVRLVESAMSAARHVAVIGGGIAGASAAYHLASTGTFDRVLLLEAERQLAQHTTGRSAAVLTENYGAGPVRPLTSASLDFLHNPPEGLVDGPLLDRRGMMTVATQPASFDLFDQLLAEGQSSRHEIVEIDIDLAAERAPHIKFSSEHRAMWEEYSHDIDVAALHQAFVRGLRADGGEIKTASRVDAARPDGDRWQLSTTTGEIPVDVVVNAAGAWGDVVAAAAGVAPVGLEPKRRTAFMVESRFSGSARFPFVAEVHHNWYTRPDGTQFMCSPADEVPSEPCDARPEEIDIARAIELINKDTNLDIRSVKSSWAGLRTFTADRAMVIGPEPEQPNFVWCVGQGGTGIQTSPGAGLLVSDLVTKGTPGSGFASIGLELAGLLPNRLRQ